ncbi:hypothetical protein HYDPIDRAFT_25630 [Hydnomerulius pinastri MD-312]|nr:hypothetical protein HYDPIDRAFT_25630 [Hydnomerulius pinastri MD-312]
MDTSYKSNRDYAAARLQHIVTRVVNHNITAIHELEFALKNAIADIEGRRPSPEPANQVIESLSARLAELQRQNTQLTLQTLDLADALRATRRTSDDTNSLLGELLPFMTLTGSLMGALGTPEAAEAMRRQGLRLVRVANDEEGPEEPSGLEIAPAAEPVQPEPAPAPESAEPSPAEAPAQSESVTDPTPAPAPSQPPNAVVLLVDNAVPDEQSPTVHAADGEVNRRRPRPLRREGAFIGEPTEEDYYRMNHLVCGRVPQPPTTNYPRAPSRWPQRPAEPHRPRANSPGAREVRERQRQLATSDGTDAYRRLIPPAYFNDAAPSSSQGSADVTPAAEASRSTQSSEGSNGSSEGASTPASSVAASPASGKGKKRAREVDEETHEEAPSTPERRGGSLLLAPSTPAGPPSIKREDGDTSDSSAKRRKISASAASTRGSPKPKSKPLTRSHSKADTTRKSGRKDKA